MQRVSHILKLSEYKNQIHLSETFVKKNPSNLNSDERKKRDEKIISELCKVNRCEIPSNLKISTANKIRLLQNITPPGLISPDIMDIIDKYLVDLYSDMKYTNIDELKTIQSYSNKNIKNPSKLYLWKGDITQLKVDAVVNACNSQLLGCFSPLHMCIDNAIHTFAGPRLRDDCDIIMKMQGFEEPTGECKITRAYNLPCKYVLHTVGPIYDEYEDKKRCEELLMSCYSKCLDLAEEVGDIKSIAFCSLSTGVFGYPIKDAVKVAVLTVDDWISKHPTSKINKIMFNLFSEEDYKVYKDFIQTSIEITH